MGFFSSEYYVKLSTGDAYIVDRNNVTVEREPKNRSEELTGKVVAYVVEPVAGGLRTWIPKSDAGPIAQAA